jgi:hypothetical protein
MILPKILALPARNENNYYLAIDLVNLLCGSTRRRARGRSSVRGILIFWLDDVIIDREIDRVDGWPNREVWRRNKYQAVYS